MNLKRQSCNQLKEIKCLNKKSSLEFGKADDGTSRKVQYLDIFTIASFQKENGAADIKYIAR